MNKFVNLHIEKIFKMNIVENLNYGFNKETKNRVSDLIDVKKLKIKTIFLSKIIYINNIYYAS